MIMFGVFKKFNFKTTKIAITAIVLALLNLVMLNVKTDNAIISVFTGFVILEISILSFIAPFVPKFLQKIASRWSKNVTTIFCIHWVIVTWSTLVIPLQSLEMFSFIMYLIILIPVSDFLANYYINLKTKEDRLKRPTIVYVLIGTLLASLISILVLSL